MKKSNKFYKYIIAISLCFVFLFVGIFSAFAYDFILEEHKAYSFGDFILENLELDIVGIGLDGVDLIETVYVSPVEAYPGAVRLEVKMVDKFIDVYDYLLSIKLKMPNDFNDTSNFYLGSYDIWLRRNGDFTINDVWSSYRYSKYSGQQNSSYRITSYDSFPTVRVIYDNQSRGTYYNEYFTSLSFHSEQATDTLYCYLGNFDMELVHPDGEILDNQNSNTSKVQSSISATQSAITSNNNSNTSKVQSSISATQSAITSNNNSNTSKVQSSISATQSAITSNNNSNTSKVQSSISKTESNLNSSISKTESELKANQDKNASDIQSNADKNTSDTISNTNSNHEEMLRGEEYDKMDGQSVDDYESAESQLNAATSQAQSDSISFINNFGSIFSGKHVTKGLLSVSAIFKEFFAVSWLSEVLTFGLGLGIFGFILGTISMVISANRRNQARAERSEYYKSKTAYYKSRKGGGS